MITARTSAILALALIVGACSDSEEPVAIEDPSKLSAELEAEAREIEQRADAAVREAETMAERELRELREEAAAASAQAQGGPAPEPNK